MAATESDQPIGIEQFRRYAAGEMSHAEQHTLEKQMLDDPMVAEAYEGFLASNTSSQDIHRINADLNIALNEKLNGVTKRVIPLWSYAAAASIMMGFGAYWLVFISEKEQNSKPEIMAAIQSEQPKIAATKEITTEIQPKPAPSTTIAPDKIADIQPNLDQAVAATAKKTPDADFNKNALADELEESVAVAEPIKTEDAAIAAAPVPAQPAAENALPAEAPARSQAFSARKQVSRMRDEHAATDSTTLSATDSSGPKPGLMPVPSVSWPAYQSYLKKSTSSGKKKGDVTVSFTVNPNGTLSGFSGEGDQKLQEQAIEILKKGPAWKPLMFKGAPVSAPAKLRLQFQSAN